MKIAIVPIAEPKGATSVGQEHDGTVQRINLLVSADGYLNFRKILLNDIKKDGTNERLQLHRRTASARSGA